MWKIGLLNWFKKPECSFAEIKKGELQELKTEKKENATGNNAQKEKLKGVIFN